MCRLQDQNGLIVLAMDPKNTGELQRHLEKQNELLRDAHRSMLHELHKLQVEEQTLMRKFYELWSAQGPSHKNAEGNFVQSDKENGLAKKHQ